MPESRTEAQSDIDLKCPYEDAKGEHPPLCQIICHFILIRCGGIPCLGQRKHQHQRNPEQTVRSKCSSPKGVVLLPFLYARKNLSQPAKCYTHEQDDTAQRKAAGIVDI
ncbi:MAG: hypothetical protein PHR81_11070 [Bacteroidales bacterium]|nr:hypothetical protein [Bacteroidales bacterium]MDD4215343.1 hypothetical protein [Bacteroidales bacterium]